MTDTPDQPSPPKSKRIEFIDLLWGCGVGDGRDVHDECNPSARTAFVGLSFPGSGHQRTCCTLVHGCRGPRLRYPVYHYGRSSPSFFLCAAVFSYKKRHAVSPRSISRLVGRESLIAYAVHLFLLYGNLWKFSFARTVGQSFNHVAGLPAPMLVIGLMIGLAHLWGKVRSMNPGVKQSVHWAITARFVVVFYFGARQ